MLLRKVNKNRWAWDFNNLPEWVSPPDFPAAPLSDFASSVDCKISVWRIDATSSNLERIVAGMAASCEHADKFDYILFSEDLLKEADIMTETSTGNSRDNEANTKWHQDLVAVSARKLTKLVELVLRHGRTTRYLESQIKRLIKSSVEAGRIDRSTLHQSLIKDVFTV